MGSCSHDEPPRHPPFHAPMKPAHVITSYRRGGTNGVNRGSMLYNPLRNRKNDGCKTLIPYQWFPNINSMGGEHTRCLYFSTEHSLVTNGQHMNIYTRNNPTDWISMHKTFVKGCICGGI
jgi:hypothetical protein